MFASSGMPLSAMACSPLTVRFQHHERYPSERLGVLWATLVRPESSNTVHSASAILRDSCSSQLAKQRHKALFVKSGPLRDSKFLVSPKKAEYCPSGCQSPQIGHFSKIPRMPMSDRNSTPSKLRLSSLFKRLMYG